MMRSMVSDTFLAIVVLVGLLLAMVGSWLVELMDTSGGVNAGHVVKSLGVTALVAGGLLGALLRHDLDKHIRGAMLLFATVVLVLASFVLLW